VLRTRAHGESEARVLRGLASGGTALAMRIVVISDWFSEVMGYAENNLPKALAALGHEVHVVTSDAQPYFDAPTYKETYEPFIGPPIVGTGTRSHDGYTLHRLAHDRVRGRLRIRGLQRRLRDLRPDIVQVFEVPNVTTLEAAWASHRMPFKLFLESHIHASVFDAASNHATVRGRVRARLLRRVLGPYISSRSELCYPISEDASAIAVEWFGVPHEKVKTCSLGVDTDLFRPPDTEEARNRRAQLRAQLGFADKDIVCIYTGRLSASKGPQILADAVQRLVERGEPYKALFVGGGTDDERAALESRQGCKVHPFVPSRELPGLYWAAEVGVWPRQESTSQLDAASCGLPIVLSDRVAVRERVDGNGCVYDEGDADDLAERLLTLKPVGVRRRMGQAGSRKMAANYSWHRIAVERSADYAAAL
jgi:glycosyltransferase involved in cell wall biosynthesis